MSIDDFRVTLHVHFYRDFARLKANKALPDDWRPSQALQEVASNMALTRPTSSGTKCIAVALGSNLHIALEVHPGADGEKALLVALCLGDDRHVAEFAENH